MTVDWCMADSKKSKSYSNCPSSHPRVPVRGLLGGIVCLSAFAPKSNSRVGLSKTRIEASATPFREMLSQKQIFVACHFCQRKLSY